MTRHAVDWPAIVARAIAACGNGAALARELGTQKESVYHWVKGTTPHYDTRRKLLEIAERAPLATLPTGHAVNLHLASPSAPREVQISAAVEACEVLAEAEDVRETQHLRRSWRRILRLAADLETPRRLVDGLEDWPAVADDVRRCGTSRAARSRHHHEHTVDAPLPDGWRECLCRVAEVLESHRADLPCPRAESWAEVRLDVGEAEAGRYQAQRSGAV